MILMDLVARGNPVMDIIYTKDREIKSPGGSSATAVVAASRLGLKSGLIGRVGDDDYGRQLIEELVRSDVDISRLRVEGSTTINHIRISSDDREIFASTNPKYLALDEVDLGYIEASRSFYARASSSVFPSVVKFCEHVDTDVFTSLQRFVPDDDYERSALYSPAIKIIFSNKDEIEEWVTKIGKKLVVVTEGKNGCTVFYNGRPEHFQPYTVDPVDPTGAGDCFAGAFIYGYMNGWTINGIAAFANRMGALATTEYGARSFISSRYHLCEVMQ